MVDFLFVMIELFSLAVEVETLTYKQILVEVSVFQTGWVTLTADFRRKGTSSPTNVGVRQLSHCCFIW